MLLGPGWPPENPPPVAGSTGGQGKMLRQRSPSGFDGWEVLETPGHTEDSLSFYKPSTQEMICGDLVVNTKT